MQFLKSVPTFIHRIPKWVFFLLALIVIGLALFWFIPLYIDRPVYIELAAPTLSTTNDWAYTDRSILELSDGITKYYLWRREGKCSVAECGSWENIADYYDKWLTARGWVKRAYDGDSPCSVVTPESKGLKREPGGYAIYRKNDGNGDTQPIPLICLVIRISSDDVKNFEIVIGSRNPSFLTVLKWELSQL